MYWLNFPDLVDSVQESRQSILAEFRQRIRAVGQSV